MKFARLLISGWLLALAASSQAAGGSDGDGYYLAGFEFHRPDASMWKRTRCGSPAGGSEQVDLITKWGKNVSSGKTPLSYYPRPQMIRLENTAAEEIDAAVLRDRGDAANWINLNGLWEWEPAVPSSLPPFGKTLNGSILVPFPVESCLSGVAPASSDDFVSNMWYRLVFDSPAISDGSRYLLNFGAVNWQSTVYLNGQNLGNNTGGYNSFSFDVSFKEKGNELLIRVFNPADSGSQPNGKQRIGAISSPGGDTYTPSSGIWQTVWLEKVADAYVSSLKIDQSFADRVVVTANAAGGDGSILAVSFQVFDGKEKIAEVSGKAGQAVAIMLPNARLWSPEDPHLYDLRVYMGDDSVLSYFGMRTFGAALSTKGWKRPQLNGKFTFFAGFLDQSFWPDGIYTAPSDDALKYDIQVLESFGLNMIRLHQKINPARWYHHADVRGLVIFQDLVQKVIFFLLFNSFFSDFFTFFELFSTGEHQRRRFPILSLI